MIYTLFITCCKFKLTRNLILKFKDSKRFWTFRSKKLNYCFDGHFSRSINMIYEWRDKTYITQTPSFNVIGYGAINKLTNYIQQINQNANCLIVTDNFLSESNFCKQIANSLKKAKIKVSIIACVQPNPLASIVNQIVNEYKKTNSNILISLGGGSAHDATKAAALLINNETNSLYPYRGLNVSRHAASNFITINTTSGTGAEVSNTAVITDENKHTKMLIVDKTTTAKATINDPTITLDLPKTSTAYTGIDVLVHAIESFLSNINSNQAQVYSLKAIKLVFDNLPTAYSAPHNKIAREKMMYAEYMAGIAFNITSLGFVHSMSHALSGMFNTPHGLANGMLLPYVLEYELKYKTVIHKLALIAKSLDLVGDNDEQLAKKLISKIRELLSTIGIPNKLDINKEITNQDINILAKKVMIDFCGISNPIQFSKKQVISIYKGAIYGK